MNPEFAVAFRDMELANLKQESATTRRVIQAVPDARKDYRPDPKYMTAHELAWHIVSAEVSLLEGVAARQFATGGPRPEKPGTIADILAWYDGHLPKTLDKVKAMSGPELTTIVEFAGVMKFPAVAYLRLVDVHSVHHRGQLSTYLRPMGAKVPSIYGPSADEAWPPR